jgi:membrane associated rhomboid family serine protease
VVRRIPWVTIAIVAICLVLQIRATLSEGVEQHVAQVEYQIETLGVEVVTEFGAQGDPNTPPGQSELIKRFRDGELGEPDDPRREQFEAYEKRIHDLMDEDPVLGLGYRPAVDGPGRMISSAFSHAGWFHFLGNMLFLYLCGINLEDRWGRVGFSVFYLLGALAAALAFKLWHPGGMVPLVGASGAVAAGMGAFLVLFATTRIRFFYAYWILLRPKAGTFETKAYVALILWFLWQLFYAGFEASMDMDTAYSAHVGGFVFGVAVAGILKVSGVDQKLEDRSEQASELFKEDARYVEAMRLIGQKQKPEAANKLREVLADNRDHEGAREALFRIALETADERRLIIDAGWYLGHASRTGEHGQVVGAYYTLRDRHPNVPVDDRALASVVCSAAALKNHGLVVEATRELMTNFPKSERVPGAMLDAAESQGESGRSDLARKTLENLVASYPNDPAATVAKDRLGPGQGSMP